MLANPIMTQENRQDSYWGRVATSLEGLVDDPRALLSETASRVRADTQSHLDILSASRYPQALTQSYESDNIRPKRKTSAVTGQQLYGGILVAQDSDGHIPSSSSAEPELETQQQRPRKRSKRTASVNDDDATGGNDDPNKKQRGRPRLDTLDETAADRRRTQIRLAQRAYRHRKETTISGLKKRVSQLEQTIEEMNQTFLTLHDSLIDACVADSQVRVARQLKAAGEKFVALAKIAAESDNDEDEKEREVPSNTASKKPRTQSTSRRAVREDHGVAESVDRASSQDLQSDAADVEELPVLDNSNSFGYLDFNEQPWSMNGNNDVMQFNAQIPEAQVAWDEIFGTANNAKLFPPTVDSLIDFKLPIERPLKGPLQSLGVYTYSFQETTFARRLHRLCLERGFRSLANPNIDPAFVKHAFRFTFCFSNRTRMLANFEAKLRRRAGESLENWNVPFIHIGGAGTHYPRRDEVTGEAIYPPNMVSPARMFGPQPWIEVETPRQEATTQEMLEALGFGGEWFDSHDVEEYLKTKGIYLDGHSSFVEVDPNMVNLPALTAGSTTSTTSGAASIGSSSSEGRNSPLETPSPTIANNDNDNMIFTTQEMIMDAEDLFGTAQSQLLPTQTDTQMTTTTGISFTGQETEKQDRNALLVDSGSDQQQSFWTTLFPPTSNITQQPPSSYTTASPSSLSSPSSFSFSFPNPTTTLPLPLPLPLSTSKTSITTTTLTFDVERFLERMVDGSACLGRAPGFRKDTIDRALALSLQEAF